jgi:hypothetical protein
MARGKLSVCLAGLSLIVSSLAVLPAAADSRESVKIGLVQTLFTDLPQPLVNVVLQPFGALMKEFTGLDGKMVLGGEPMNLAKELEHCRLFLGRACSECGSMNPQSFFSQVVASSNVERGLDDLCLGKVDCVVVDTVSLDNYSDIKPGCRARLAVLKNSEQFPTGLIAYRDGLLDEETIGKFRTGLVNGNKTDRGREMMGLFRITAFENVPDDYEQNLIDILKSYPAPESASPVSSQR